MNFINTIVSGFNNVISFLGNLFSPLFNVIASGFTAILNFLTKPLAYVYYFFDGVFYFISKLFSIVVLVIQIFVAFFQFIGALISGIFRTIQLWLVPSLTSTTHFPSASEQGFQAVIDQLNPTGLLTVVPIVAIAFCWFYFVLKIISMFGGSVMVSPFGRGGKD